MLRITIQEQLESVTIKLEGRLTGPWVLELAKAWSDTKRGLLSRKVRLDLCGLTWTDDKGKQMLREIYTQVAPEVISKDPWTQQIAAEMRKCAVCRTPHG